MSSHNLGKQEKPGGPDQSPANAKPEGEPRAGNNPRDKSGKAPAPKQSPWRSTADVWPFVVGSFGCALAAYFLTYAGSAYEQPNSLTTGATVMLMIAGACVLAATVGLVHLAFSVSAKVLWAIGAGLGVVLSVAAFVVAGMHVAPGFVFCVAFLVLCVPGYFLGRRADDYRAQFPKRSHFLGDWD